jgi:hypothetical protein
VLRCVCLCFVFRECARAAKMAGHLCSGVFMCLFACVCVRFRTSDDVKLLTGQIPDRGILRGTRKERRVCVSVLSDVVHVREEVYKER